MHSVILAIYAVALPSLLQAVAAADTTPRWYDNKEIYPEHILSSALQCNGYPGPSRYVSSDQQYNQTDDDLKNVTTLTSSPRSTDLTKGTQAVYCWDMCDRAVYPTDIMHSYSPRFITTRYHRYTMSFDFDQPVESVLIYVSLAHGVPRLEAEFNLDQTSSGKVSWRLPGLHDSSTNVTHTPQNITDYRTGNITALTADALQRRQSLPNSNAEIDLVFVTFNWAYPEPDAVSGKIEVWDDGFRSEAQALLDKQQQMGLNETANATVLVSS